MRTAVPLLLATMALACASMKPQSPPTSVTAPISNLHNSDDPLDAYFPTGMLSPAEVLLDDGPGKEYASILFSLEEPGFCELSNSVDEVYRVTFTDKAIIRPRSVLVVRVERRGSDVRIIAKKGPWPNFAGSPTSPPPIITVGPRAVSVEQWNAFLAAVDQSNFFELRPWVRSAQPSPCPGLSVNFHEENWGHWLLEGLRRSSDGLHYNVVERSDDNELGTIAPWFWRACVRLVAASGIDDK